MKIGFYNEFLPCIVKNNGVVDISDAVKAFKISSPQHFMERIIVNFSSLKSALAALESTGTVIPMDKVTLRAPLPRPGKVLCGNGNFMEGIRITPTRPLKTFFKSPDAIIGPGETVVLPAFRPVIFNHEAELGVVIGKEGHNLSESEALSYVFGYTTAVDVSARAPEEGEASLPGDYGKSFDTFLPIGPSIITADEISNPNDLDVQYWVNEELRQTYNTSDMEHSIAYMIATLSHVMTLKPGDLILAGTNHGHLGPLQDGDFAEIEIEKVGRSSQRVVDSLKRTWDPHELRQPADMQARRESMKSMPNAGTWPFQPKGG
jgi:2-keto-4-pentenoate hydratase/2-oxohepta-3-ene-1,7-dioic acid hydratase in catechol pathway